jgi:ABC-type Fe3+-hydroxamate transport system substrate-binding protein
MMNENDVDFLVDAAGQRHRPWMGPARIVSLVPSLTELVCELGLADSLVGRTGFCVHPRAVLKAVPKLGGTKDVNLERLRALAPTHVIVNIDENRKDCVEEIARFVPNVIVTHPCRPEDNLPLYRLFGAVFGCEARAAVLAAELMEAIALAQVAGRDLPRDKVLYLIWREPWMTVAPDTYIAASLALVGWDSWPALGDGVRYPAFDWNAPWLAEVSRVFLSSEPYRFGERHVDEVAGLARRPVRLIDGEMTSWYGSRAAAGLRYLAALRRELAA